MRPVVALLCAATAWAAGAVAFAAVPASNAQFWGEVDLTVPITPTVSATAIGVVRDGDGLPNPTLTGGGVIVDARVGSLTFTAGDIWAAARGAVSGRTIDVDVPLVAATYGWRFAGADFDDCNRVERLDGAPGNPWRYRNLLLVERPLTGLGPIRSVFASDEVFYDFGREKWSRNRAQIGLGLPISKRAQARIYYLRQDDRYARPGTLHALGLTYRLDLR